MGTADVKMYARNEGVTTLATAMARVYAIEVRNDVDMRGCLDVAAMIQS